jgi:membrane associated rhomboid family serine protease
MGIQDRDYYRDEARRFNPFGRSQATVALIVILGFVFIAQVATRDDRRLARNPEVLEQQTGLTEILQLDPKKTLGGEVWRIASHAVIHDSYNFLHILFTFVFLGWIGSHIEDIYGWKEYVAYFVLTAILGGLAYTMIAAFSGNTLILRGPSGPVTAILVLYALHYPYRTILLFFFLPVPVWLLVGIYAFADIAALSSGVANPAAIGVHFTAAAFAFIYHRYTLRVLNWVPTFRKIQHARRMKTTNLKIYHDPPKTLKINSRGSVDVIPSAGAAGSAGGVAVDEYLEAKLDQVLEKVTRYGKQSLTDAEQDILKRASEIYKKRRQG